MRAARGDNDADVLGRDTPAQVQIYRQMKAEILDGLWVGRSDFPGDQDLAERFGVSVVTSRAVLERLARDGLVQRSRGRRTRAMHVPPVPRPGPGLHLFPPEGPSGFSYRLEREGTSVAPAAACHAFGVEVGTRMWQTVRTILVHGEPWGVFHNVQRPEIGERHDPADLATEPMLSILASEGVGLTAIRRRVGATTASPDAARHLGLSLDAPVLRVVFTAEVEGGATIEWTRLIIRPDQQLPEEVLDLRTGVWSSTPATASTE
jgi:GntR family transcriptional regulator